jgi:hypothetical protein
VASCCNTNRSAQQRFTLSGSLASSCPLPNAPAGANPLARTTILTLVACHTLFILVFAIRFTPHIYLEYVNIHPLQASGSGVAVGRWAAPIGAVRGGPAQEHPRQQLRLVQVIQGLLLAQPVPASASCAGSSYLIIGRGPEPHSALLSGPCAHKLPRCCSDLLAASVLCKAADAAAADAAVPHATGSPAGPFARSTLGATRQPPCCGTGRTASSSSSSKPGARVVGRLGMGPCYLQELYLKRKGGPWSGAAVCWRCYQRSTTAGRRRTGKPAK